MDIYDGSGATVGVGHLSAASDSGTPLSAPDRFGLWSVDCHFTFQADGVKKADFYRVSIPGAMGATYSYADLAGQNWHVTVRR